MLGHSALCLSGLSPLWTILLPGPLLLDQLKSGIRLYPQPEHFGLGRALRGGPGSAQRKSKQPHITPGAVGRLGPRTPGCLTPKHMMHFLHSSFS